MNKLNKNYHTHSIFCDGKGLPEEYVNKAIELGFTSLGFSSHAPVPFKNDWSLVEEKVMDYKNEIIRLKNKYKDKIEIKLGLEIDYIPDVTTSFENRRNDLELDYVIGSVHLVKSENNGELWFIDGPEEGYKKGMENLFSSPQKAVEAYFNQINEMIIKERPNIVGHFDKVRMYNHDSLYFEENSDWYRDLINNTLNVFKQHNTIVEINTRGIYRKKLKDFFPQTWIIKECIKKEINLIVNSDAHSPNELNGYFDETYNMLKEFGIDINYKL